MQFSGSSGQRMFCSDGFDTMHLVCTDLLCVACIGLLPAEFSTVNTGLGRPVLRTHEGLADTNYQLT